MARPIGIESRRRQREFVRLLADGQTWRDAARNARVDPSTVLTLLDEPAFRAVARALLDGRADVAAVVAADIQAEAVAA